MLSITDLLTLTKKPKIQDVSLQTLQLFYDKHLCNKLFIFETDEPNHPLIQIRFKDDNLCHLLGIHHIFKNQRGSKKYTGKEGYEAIKNGKITFDTLKTTNKREFKNQKNRMLYFPFVYQILNNPTAITFSKEILTKPTNLELDIIFYNQFDNIYLHLGIGQDKDSSYYYPKSFMDRNNDDYIKGQKEIKILSKHIEVLKS